MQVGGYGIVPQQYFYRADDKHPDPDEKWCPSIFMPRDAARIFLRITGVKAQRPQDLAHAEILAEGIDCLLHIMGNEHVCNPCPARDLIGCSARVQWAELWDSVQQKKYLPLYGYSANPWCWVYEFERVVPDEI